MFGERVNRLASTVAGMMMVFATVKQLCPDAVKDFNVLLLERIVSYLRPEGHISFYEYDSAYRDNAAYRAIEAYLGTISTSPSSNATHFIAEKADKRSSSKSLVFILDDYEDVVDEFEGVKFSWRSNKIPGNRNTGVLEKKYFTITFGRKYQDFVISSYLMHVLEEGETIRKSRRTRMLFSNKPSSQWNSYNSGLWKKVVFEHPATFENLAMDSAKKEDIVEDLITFSKSKDYYKRIGRAWKRGYLLYGPPGTGKSTMIACIANLLNYDVYDLDLTILKNNNELRNLLINTSGKAIIVIEDIDCTLPITMKRTNKSSQQKQETSNNLNNEDDDSDSGDGEGDDDDDDNDSEGDEDNDTSASPQTNTNSDSKVTLSGLLNIIDGLWSPCGEERIVVFTTNHIEKLDPALIRTGRMDKHIHMSYCSFEAFKIFARNYLNVESHPYFDKIEKLLKEIKVRPSDVAENMLPKTGNVDPENSLKAVIEAIEKVKELAQTKKGKSKQNKSKEG